MKQRFDRYSPELVDLAVSSYLSDKWNRSDTLSFIEKYAGIPRHEILLREVNEKYASVKAEAISSLSLYVQGVCEDLFYNGIEPDLDPVIVRQRPDGMTGKVRSIALLPVLHQLLEHVAVEMLRPLFMARFLPQQHASIPGHGQTALKNQLHKYLRSDRNIKAYTKDDIVHAYGTTKYLTVIERIEKDLPKAKELSILLRFLAKRAPGGVLIIGGYLDAWLFNYVMSFALKHVLSLGQTRRGVFRPYVIRCECYMDDVVLLCPSLTAASKASKLLGDYLGKEFGLALKVETAPVKLETIDEERARRSAKHRSARGSPAVDMAGFRVRRSYITIRPRVFRRLRRQFMRAWVEYKKTGTIPFYRAKKLNSYNGYIRRRKGKRGQKLKPASDSLYARKKYHIDELMRIAAAVQSFHDRDARRRKIEALNDYDQCISKFAAGCSDARSVAGWPKPRRALQKH